MKSLGIAEQVTRTIAGGCDWVQLRMKNHSEEQIIAEAKKINALDKRSEFKLIINDNPRIAQLVNADGVHLGKNDMAPAEARKILGDDFIIGGTANTLEDIIRLTDQGVDYIGLGPFRFTSTKENLSPILGLEGYRQIRSEMAKRNITTPIVGIGGITFQDILELMQTELHGLAVSSAILQRESVVEETSRWLSSIQRTKSKK